MSLELNLKPGRKLLEASAGTGKTHQITSIFNRLVLEYDVKVSELLVVTFTRAATAELRERIHSRLEAALHGIASPNPAPEVVAQIREELESIERAGITVETAKERLSAALRELDTAPVYTIHGFCQRVLSDFPLEAGVAMESELVQDASALRDQCFEDAYLGFCDGLSGEQSRLLNLKSLREGAAKMTKELANDASLQLHPHATSDDIVRQLAMKLVDATSDDEPLLALIDRALTRATQIFADEGPEIIDWLRRELDAKKLTGQKVKPGTIDLLEHMLKGGPVAAIEAARGDRDSTAWSALRFVDVEAYNEGGYVRKNCTVEPPAAMERLREPLLAFIGLVPAFELRAQAIIAQEALRRFRVQMRARGEQTFADVIGNLAEALRREEQDGGPGPLAQRLAKRYRAALIDEFQDTDGDQWEIFRRIFANPDQWLMLIGDPKQSIYNFRGANVAVYESAKQTVPQDSRYPLPVNWRSDEAYNEAMNALFARAIEQLENEYAPGGLSSGGALTDDDSAEFVLKSYSRVQTAQKNLGDPGFIQSEAPELCPLETTGPAGAPLILRVMDTEASELEFEPNELVVTARHVAADIAATLYGGHVTLRETGEAPQPRDCAVLVARNREAELVRRELARRQIPAVKSRAGSLWESAALDEMLAWLDLVESPNNSRAQRRFVTGPFVAMTGEELLAHEDELLTHWSLAAATWRKRFLDYGLYAALHASLRTPWRGVSEESGEVIESGNLAGRMVSGLDGERMLANLLQLAEEVHSGFPEGLRSIRSCRRWLLETASARSDSSDDSARLESDEEAVQIMTVHTSKGLQFPFVWLPYSLNSSSSVSAVTDPAYPTRRIYCDSAFSDVSKKAPQLAEARVFADDDPDTLFAQWSEETASIKQRQEKSSDAVAMRLLYVGLTRARHRTTVYIADKRPKKKTKSHPQPTHARRLFPWLLSEEGLEMTRAGELAPYLRCERIEAQRSYFLHRDYRPQADITREPAKLVAPEHSVSGDTTWGISSFSSLLRLAPGHHDPSPDLSEAELAAEDSNSSEHAAYDPAEALTDLLDAGGELSSPQDSGVFRLASFPAGTDAGSALHGVMELIDFSYAMGANTAPGRQRALGAFAEVIEAELPAYGFMPELWAKPLAEGLIDVVTTPLGGPLEGKRLADISMRDRRDEMQFYIPIGDGRELRARSDEVFNALLREHNDDISSAISRACASPERGQLLGGYLTGLIDLTFRATIDGQERWFVADYKSNRLVRAGEETTHETWRREAILSEMQTHNYFLQYHLYLLALHRWLKRTLPDYSYERNIGGAYYLFMRGMTGKDTPQEGAFTRAVFFDRPTESQIEALERALCAPSHRMTAGGA